MPPTIENRNSGSQKPWIFLLKLCIGAGLIVWLISKVGLENLWGQLKQVSPAFYVMALAAYVGGESLRTIRWQWLLRAVGHEFRLSRLVQLQLIGSFFNHFLPTSVGGDGARVVYLYRDNVPWDKALASVLLERIIGMLMLLFLGLASGGIYYGMTEDRGAVGHKEGLQTTDHETTGLQDHGLRDHRTTDQPAIGNRQSTIDNRQSLNPSIAVALFLAAFAAGVFFLFSERAFRLLLDFIEAIGLHRLTPVLERFSAAIRVYRAHPKVLVWVALVSVAFQFVVVGLCYLFSLRVGMTVSAGYFFLLTPIVLSLAMVPISPGGIGVREWAAVLLFGQVGAKEPQVLALMMFYWLLTLGTGLIGGVVFVFSKERKPEESVIRNS